MVMEYINNNNKKWSVKRFEILPSISVLKGFNMIQLHISWFYFSTFVTI